MKLAPWQTAFLHWALTHALGTERGEEAFGVVMTFVAGKDVPPSA